MPRRLGTYVQQSSSLPPVLYKFPVVAVEAVTGKSGLSDFEALEQLHETCGVAYPKAVDGLETAPVLHETVVAGG